MIMKIFTYALFTAVSAFFLTAYAYAESDHAIHTRIREVIFQEVHSRLDMDSLSVTVDIPDQPLQAASSLKINDIRLEWGRSNDHLRGRVVLPVRLYYENMNSFVIYARAEIKWFRKVCVSSSRIARHQLFEDSNIIMEIRDISDVSGEPFSCVSDIEGMRSRHLIQSGRIITQNMTEMPPTIKRGEKVTIRMMRGRLLITSTGIARQDGWMGDEIRIRTPQNQQEIKARVAGSQMVDLFF